MYLLFPSRAYQALIKRGVAHERDGGVSRSDHCERRRYGLPVLVPPIEDLPPPRGATSKLHQGTKGSKLMHVSGDPSCISATAPGDNFQARRLWSIHGRTAGTATFSLSLVYMYTAQVTMHTAPRLLFTIGSKILKTFRTQVVMTITSETRKTVAKL